MISSALWRICSFADSAFPPRGGFIPSLILRFRLVADLFLRRFCASASWRNLTMGTGPIVRRESYHGLPPGQGPPSGWSEPASSLACDCNRTTFIEGFSYCFLSICCVIMLSS